MEHQTPIDKSIPAKEDEEVSLAELLEDEDDTDEDSFLARVMEASAFSKRKSDDLIELFATNREAYEDRLDEMATDIAMKNPEFLENIAVIKQYRARKQEKTPAAQALKQRQNELLDMYRRFIISEAEIPDQTRQEQIEGAKRNVADILEAAHGNSYTTLEALKTLGFYTVEEQTGKKIFHFPKELFPDSVTEKWYIYLASVCRDSQAASKVEGANEASKERAIQLDRQRRYAHLSATDDVHQILGLHENDPYWKYDDTKNLLASIRDTVLPNMESTLSPAAYEFVQEHIAGLDTCESLCQKSDS